MFPGRFGEIPAGGFICDPWFRGPDAATIIQHVECYYDAAPEEVYHPGGPAAGTITGGVAGNVLSPVLTPHYQQVLTGIADDPLGAGFDDGTTDSFDAANAAIHNFTVGAFALLTTVCVTTVVHSSRNVLGKRSTIAPNPGWAITANTTHLTAAFDDGVAFAFPSVAYIAPLNPVLLFRSITGGIVGIRTLVGEQTSGVIAGSLGSVQLFSLGSNVSSATQVVVGPTIIWRGATAEAVITNRAVTLPAWATATGAF